MRKNFFGRDLLIFFAIFSIFNFFHIVVKNQKYPTCSAKWCNEEREYNSIYCSYHDSLYDITYSHLKPKSIIVIYRTVTVQRKNQAHQKVRRQTVRIIIHTKAAAIRTVLTIRMMTAMMTFTQMMITIMTDMKTILIMQTALTMHLMNTMINKNPLALEAKTQCCVRLSGAKGFVL